MEEAELGLAARRSRRCLAALRLRVREENTGGRVELGKPRGAFVMIVALLLPSRMAGCRKCEALMYLPPTTERQTVHQLACLPEPTEVTKDTWGNEIARFVLDRPGAAGVATACWLAHVTLCPLTTRLVEGEPARGPRIWRKPIACF